MAYDQAQLMEAWDNPSCSLSIDQIRTLVKIAEPFVAALPYCIPIEGHTNLLHHRFYPRSQTKFHLAFLAGKLEEHIGKIYKHVITFYSFDNNIGLWSHLIVFAREFLDLMVGWGWSEFWVRTQRGPEQRKRICELVKRGMNPDSAEDLAKVGLEGLEFGGASGSHVSCSRESFETFTTTLDQIKLFLLEPDPELTQDSTTQIATDQECERLTITMKDYLDAAERLGGWRTGKEIAEAAGKNYNPNIPCDLRKMGYLESDRTRGYRRTGKPRPSHSREFGLTLHSSSCSR